MNDEPRETPTDGPQPVTMETPASEGPRIPAGPPDAPGEQAGAELEEKTSAVIRCHGLTKMHGQVIAVNDLTVDIGPGITGLLGPNGAGKSTLMRMIMGLQRPSSGTLRVYGAQPWDNHTLLPRLGYVPEADAPWQEDAAMTVAVRVARLSGMGRDEATAAAERSIAQVGLGGDADRPIEEFSKGMRQRLKFALALMHDPDLLILDEPLLGADPLTRRHLIEIIKDHARAGGSVLVSSHILSDVDALTDQILVIDSGRRRAFGTISEIRDWLEQYPRTIRIGCPEPRELASEMTTWTSVVSVEAEEHGVIVRTDAPQAFYDQLQRHLIESEAPFDSIRALDEDIESVFRYLVGGRR